MEGMGKGMGGKGEGRREGRGKGLEGKEEREGRAWRGGERVGKGGDPFSITYSKILDPPLGSICRLAISLRLLRSSMAGCG